MGTYSHKKKLEELDCQIQEAENEMRTILMSLGLDKITSLNDIKDSKLRSRYDLLEIKVQDLKKKKKGGYRTGSGRKSKYDGFRTCVIRVPEIFKEEVERFIEEKMAKYGYEKHETEWEKNLKKEKAEAKAKAQRKLREYLHTHTHQSEIEID